MRDSQLALLGVVFLVATYCTAYSHDSVSRISVEHSNLQHVLGSSSGPGPGDISSILDDPEKASDLFCALTTGEAAHELDHKDIKNYQVNPHHITFGHQVGPSKVGSESDQDVKPDHPASLEVYMSTIGGYPIYHAPIALGNPAQPFRAWLNPRLNGLYVRSSACSQQDCGSNGFSYDGTQSKTRKSLDKRFEVFPKGWTVGGNVSSDTLHLASLAVDRAMVGEIDKYEGEELFYYVMEFVVDGALGIAPPSKDTAAYSPVSAPNPLQDLVRSHALEHNVLTLTLPANVNDRGSLQIGRRPRSQNTMIRIPFADQTAPGLANTWHVPLSSVSLSGKTKFHLPLKSVYGRLDLDPAIMLPPKATKELYKAIGANPSSLFRGASIDCKARKQLPDLVLDIGGNDIRLTRDEYSAEHFAYGRAICVVLVLPSDDEHIAVLGTQLMMKYHVVFDIDENEMGLVSRT